MEEVGRAALCLARSFLSPSGRCEELPIAHCEGDETAFVKADGAGDSRVGREGLIRVSKVVVVGGADIEARTG
jgi:hypothetical protein